MTSLRFVVVALLVGAAVVGGSVTGPVAGAQTAPPNYVVLQVVIQGTPPPTFHAELDAACAPNGGSMIPTDTLDATFDAAGQPSPQVLAVPESPTGHFCTVDYDSSIGFGVPAGVAYTATLQCTAEGDVPQPACPVGTRHPFVQFDFGPTGGATVTVSQTFVFAPDAPPPVELAPAFTG